MLSADRDDVTTDAVDSTHSAEVSPCDDFYAHVNGRWLCALEKQPNSGMAGGFREAWDTADRRLLAIINADSPLSDLSTFHDSIIGAADLTLTASTCLGPELATIDSLHSIEDLPRVLAHLHMFGIRGPWELTVAYSSSRGGHILKVKPNRRRTSTYSQIESMLTTAGFAGADSVDSIERSVVAVLDAQTTPALSDDAGEVVVTPHQMSNEFDWTGWLSAYGIHTASTVSVLVTDGATVTSLVRAVHKYSADEIRAWLRWLVIDVRNFEVNGAEINSAAINTATRRLAQRRVAALRQTERFFGATLTRRYHAEYTDPTITQQVQAMSHTIRQSFLDMIDRSWLSASGRAWARDVISSVHLEIGRSDLSASSFEFDVLEKDPYGNIRRGCAAELRDLLSNLKRTDPVDSSPTDTYSATGSYDHATRRLRVPSGLLALPFFDPDQPPARNYATLGVIIGHELAHCVDLSAWSDALDSGTHPHLTRADTEQLRARLAVLLDQHRDRVYDVTDASRPAIDVARVLNEVLCDHVGMSLAVAALDSFESESAHVDMTTFFSAWTWMMRTAGTSTNSASDPHPPADVRCTWVLRNTAAFHSAFGTQAGNGMWLPHKRRFTLFP